MGLQPHGNPKVEESEPKHIKALRNHPVMPQNRRKLGPLIALNLYS
jgi:hypothetical protein